MPSKFSQVLLLCFSFLVIHTEARYDFTSCKTTIQEVLNQTITNATLADGITPLNSSSIQTFLWEGSVKGFTADRHDYPDYITVTLEGCKAICGADKFGLNSIYTAFAILTTWVLPAVALFSNLPWESLSKKKIKALEAFTNWIGSPQAALANTMFNVYIIKQCQDRSGNGLPISRDAYYVLSCINQYEYPSYEKTHIGKGWNAGAQTQRQRARDEVLLYGLFRPLSHHQDRTAHEPADVQDTRILLSNLAHQLRMLRRRGVYPQSINVLWFLVSFVISLVTAFADLGDNTTALSLALGLLLSWLPVLITMMVVDRNPSASTRCKVLIERWLYNVNFVLRQRFPEIERLDGMSYAQWWCPGARMDLLLGDFVGQGRRLRYCGIGNGMLQLTSQWDYIPDEEPYKLESQYRSKVLNFRKKHLIRRPYSWWLIWLAAQYQVTMSVSMAFMVSFNSPTVGLGCRSLMAMMWWILSTISWIVLAIWQESPRWTRLITMPINTASTLLLFLIMMFQVTGGLNNCQCQASVFGMKNFGGYIDFENAEFYKSHFDVVKFWWIAASLGLITSIVFISWALRQWSKSDQLWRAEEEPSASDTFAEQDYREPYQSGSLDPIIPVDLTWLI